MPHPNYPCEDCVNNSSPVCNDCVTVNLGKPNNFIPHRDVHMLVEKSSPKESITRCLQENKPIPVAWVVAYNKIIDKAKGE